MSRNKRESLLGRLFGDPVEGAHNPDAQSEHTVVALEAELVIVADPSGVVRRFNACAEKMLGFRAGSVIKRRSLDSLLVPDFTDRLARELMTESGVERYGFACLAELAKAKGHRRDWLFRHANGEPVPIRGYLLASGRLSIDEGYTLIGHMPGTASGSL